MVLCVLWVFKMRKETSILSIELWCQIEIKLNLYRRKCNHALAILNEKVEPIPDSDSIVNWELCK